MLLPVELWRFAGIIPALAEREYTLFCDESEQVGRYFSSFYGGLLVGGTNYLPVTVRL